MNIGGNISTVICAALFFGASGCGNSLGFLSGGSSNSKKSSEAPSTDKKDDNASESVDVTGAYLTCATVSGAGGDGKTFGCNAVMNNGKAVKDYGYDIAFDVVNAAGDSVAFTENKSSEGPWAFVASIATNDVANATVVSSAKKGKDEFGFVKPVAEMTATANGAPDPVDPDARIHGRYVTGLAVQAAADSTKLGMFDYSGSIAFDWVSGRFSLRELHPDKSAVFRLPISLTLSDGTVVTKTVLFARLTIGGRFVPWMRNVDLTAYDWSHIRALNPAAVTSTFDHRINGAGQSDQGNPNVPTVAADSADSHGIVLTFDDVQQPGNVYFTMRFPLEIK